MNVTVKIQGIFFLISFLRPKQYLHTHIAYQQRYTRIHAHFNSGPPYIAPPFVCLIPKIIRISLCRLVFLFLCVRSNDCDLVRGECTQTYVPYLFLVIPLGPVTLTGQDYVLVESGCVCKPKGSSRATAHELVATIPAMPRP